MTTEDAVVRSLEPLVYSVASRYRLPRGDHESVRQEALLAALEGVRSFDGARGASLPSHVYQVVTRRLVDVLKAELREKRRGQNEAVELGESVMGGREPFDVVAERDELRRLVRGIRALTPIEKDAVVRCCFDDQPIGSKRSDNALTRARRKLREAA